jgi:hypothetical protein
MNSIALFFTVWFSLIQIGFTLISGVFYPIRRMGAHWLADELTRVRMNQFNNWILNCYQQSPLKVETINKLPWYFSVLVAYRVSTGDGPVYSVWRFTKSAKLLNQCFEANKLRRKKHLRF